MCTVIDAADDVSRIRPASRLLVALSERHVVVQGVLGVGGAVVVMDDERQRLTASRCDHTRGWRAWSNRALLGDDRCASTS